MQAVLTLFEGRCAGAASGYARIGGYGYWIRPLRPCCTCGGGSATVLRPPQRAARQSPKSPWSTSGAITRHTTCSTTPRCNPTSRRSRASLDMSATRCEVYESSPPTSDVCQKSRGPSRGTECSRGQARAAAAVRTSVSRWSTHRGEGLPGGRRDPPCEVRSSQTRRLLSRGLAIQYRGAPRH
jgi:hypothetical protein